jgi:hypothetical protein
MYVHNLDLILDPLQEICSRGRGIWDGVASGQSSIPSHVKLPKSLVEAFENVVLLLVSAVRMFPVTERYSNMMLQRSGEGDYAAKKDRELLEALGTEVSHLAKCAKEWMQRAERDIMVLEHTNTGIETISYDSVGPEYLLATIMASLFNRPLYNGEQTDIVYASFYRRLVCKLSSHRHAHPLMVTNSN